MTSILIGVRGDAQSELMSQFASHTFYWDDFGNKWTVSFHAHHATILAHSNRITDQTAIEKIPITHTKLLYVRYPSAERGPIGAVYLLLSLLARCHIVGIPYQERVATNKLSQLRWFGNYAPYTIVTNDNNTLRHHKNCVVKSISTVRSQVTLLNTDDIPTDPLPLPVCIQQYVDGKEYKIHLLYKTKRPYMFTVHIESNETDYRYAIQPPVYRVSHFKHSTCIDIADQVRRSTGSTFFDMDIITRSDGTPCVLEWNDSPASAYIEYLAKQSIHFSRKIFDTCYPILISLRQDKNTFVLRNQTNSQNIISLFLEDLGKSWHYSLDNHKLRFHLQNTTITPTAIYVRTISPDSNTRITDLFTVLNIWQGTVIGKSALNFTNSSKPLQMITSLRRAIQRTSHSPVQLPTTHIIKGRVALSDYPTHIVKSCSSVRSIVTPVPRYRADFSEVSLHTPTLFQERISGHDIRTHVLNQKTWNIQVVSKDTIDYRYTQHRSEFETHTLPKAVCEFAQNVSREEKNPLVGIDFLLKDGVYYCLEANPSPGWSWYYSELDTHNNPFVKNLAGYLIGHTSTV